jgi:hypothetical protein
MYVARMVGTRWHDTTISCRNLAVEFLRCLVLCLIGGEEITGSERAAQIDQNR